MDSEERIFSACVLQIFMTSWTILARKIISSTICVSFNRNTKNADALRMSLMTSFDKGKEKCDAE